jgi:hypothetical protein
MPAKTAAKKPLLMARMTNKRLAFCKKYLKWTPNQWENMMFLNELKFCLDRGAMVRRPSGISHPKQ